MTNPPVPTSVHHDHHISWPPVKLVEHPAFRPRATTSPTGATHRVPAPWPTAPVRVASLSRPAPTATAGCI